MAKAIIYADSAFTHDANLSAIRASSALNRACVSLPDRLGAAG